MTPDNTSQSGGEVSAREAAAKEIWEFGVPVDRAQQYANAAIDAFLAASKPEDDRVEEIRGRHAADEEDDMEIDLHARHIHCHADRATLLEIVTSLSAKLKEAESKLAGHVTLGRIAAKSLNLTTDELTALEAEVERLQRLVLVPGMWKCAKCCFVAMQMVLRAADGAVGVKADSKTEICPNGCGPLWPVTERDAGNDLADRLEKVTIERLSAQLTAQKAAHAKMLRDEAATFEIGGDVWLQDKINTAVRKICRRLADKIEGREL